MTQRGHDFFIWRRGAMISFWCVLFHHRLGPPQPNGWKRCTRRGCTVQYQWTKDPTGAPST